MEVNDVTIVIGVLSVIVTQITEEIREEVKASIRKIFSDIIDEEFRIIDNMNMKSSLGGGDIAL